MAATRLRFTAVYEPAEEGWTQARIAELPAVITAAPSREEAQDQLVDALREYLLSLRDDAAADARASGETEHLDIVLDA